jgi:hypothetical protein
VSVVEPFTDDPSQVESDNDEIDAPTSTPIVQTATRISTSASAERLSRNAELTAES